jgi:outer membrane lipoprotein-sorting protein
MPADAQLRLPFIGSRGEVIPYALSPQEQADVLEMERVFNAIRTVDAEFVQTSDNELSQGRILLSRPNGLRMEYEEPAPHILIGKGNAIMYHDRHLEQTTFLPVSRTPAAFIMRDNLNMREGVVIVGFERRGSFRRVTLVQEDDADEGAITLVFETNPMRFVGWKILDPAGEEVNISLVGPRYGVRFDDSVFDVVDPKVEALPPLPPR